MRFPLHLMQLFGAFMQASHDQLQSMNKIYLNNNIEL
jgi:hypothetical protein